MAAQSRPCPSQQGIQAGIRQKGFLQGPPSLQELLSLVSLVQCTFLFLLQSFGIFISLCDMKCKIISMAAPAAGWLASQLLQGGGCGRVE